MNDPNDHIYVLFGADDILYWVKFTDDEYKNQRHLTKPVRLSKLCNINSEYFHIDFCVISVERKEDKLIFKDDFIEYELSIPIATLFVAPYQTK